MDESHSTQAQKTSISESSARTAGLGHERFYLNLDKLPGPDEQVLRNLLAATNVSSTAEHTSIEDELNLPKSSVADEFQQRRNKHHEVKPHISTVKLTDREQKIQNNPYVQMLASPLRFDYNSTLNMPRDLLLLLTIVRDNDTGNLWQTSYDMLWPKPLARPLKPPKSFVAPVDIPEYVSHKNELDAAADQQLFPVNLEKHDLSQIREMVSRCLDKNEQPLAGDFDVISKLEDARMLALLRETQLDTDPVCLTKDFLDFDQGTPVLCETPDKVGLKAFEEFEAGTYQSLPANYSLLHKGRINVPISRRGLESMAQTTIKKVKDLPTPSWRASLKQEIYDRDKAQEKLFRLDMIDLVVRQAKQEALTELRKVMQRKAEVIVVMNQEEMAALESNVAIGLDFCAILKVHKNAITELKRNQNSNPIPTFNLRQLFSDKNLLDIPLPQIFMEELLLLKTCKLTSHLVKRLYRLSTISVR